MTKTLKRYADIFKMQAKVFKNCLKLARCVDFYLRFRCSHKRHSVSCDHGLGLEHGSFLCLKIALIPQISLIGWALLFQRKVFVFCSHFKTSITQFSIDFITLESLFSELVIISQISLFIFWPPMSFSREHYRTLGTRWSLFFNWFTEKAAILPKFFLEYI